MGVVGGAQHPPLVNFVLLVWHFVEGLLFLHGVYLLTAGLTTLRFLPVFVLEIVLELRALFRHRLPVAVLLSQRIFAGGGDSRKR
jgi:hypothetical protein